MLRSALLSALVASSCASGKSPSPPTPRVIVETAGGTRRVVSVEVARTDEQRRKGLMFRREMAPDAGMLFLFEETAVQGFWMRNTLIPLDMIFVSEDLRIVGIVEQAEPLTEVNRSVGVPSRYVLEVNGGWASRNGVRSGDRVRFENVLF